MYLSIFLLYLAVVVVVFYSLINRAKKEKEKWNRLEYKRKLRKKNRSKQCDKR